MSESAKMPIEAVIIYLAKCKFQVEPDTNGFLIRNMIHGTALQRDANENDLHEFVTGIEYVKANQGRILVRHDYRETRRKSAR